MYCNCVCVCVLRAVAVDVVLTTVDAVIQPISQQSLLQSATKTYLSINCTINIK